MTRPKKDERISVAAPRPAKPSREETERTKHRWRESALRLNFPDLEKLKQRKSLTSKRAAANLRCSELSIRRLVDDLKLTRSENGRIVVDEKFVEEYQMRHGPGPEERVKAHLAALRLDAGSFFSPRVLARIFDPKPELASPPPIAEPREPDILTPREEKLWKIIRRGSKSLTYCREVDAAAISPPRKGVWKDGPRKYLAAYQSGDNRLVHWIQSEKSKIRRKAELAGLATIQAELPSE